MNDIETLLQSLAQKINITNEQYVDMFLFQEKLRQNYREWRLFPQGSIRLGTIIKPYAKNSDERPYDMDIVVQFSEITHNFSSPKALKDMAKTPIIHHSPEEKKPCWVILPSQKLYSVDITPAVADAKKENSKWGQHALKVTRTEDFITYNWKDSNPSGYYYWFKEINQEAYTKADSIQSKKLMESMQKIGLKEERFYKPLVRTNLQRAIQVVKWLRDMYFEDRPNHEEKPISIILTTLMASVFTSSDVDSTIEDIVKIFIKVMKEIHADKGVRLNTFSRKDKLIDPVKAMGRENDIWDIPNPTDKNENFADRWNKDNGKRAAAFFEFIDYLSNLLNNTGSLEDIVYPPQKTPIIPAKPYAR